MELKVFCKEILFLLIVFCNIKESFSITVKAESLKVRIISLADCTLPKSEYDVRNYINHSMSAYKVDRSTTKIKANFSFENKIGPISTTARSYDNGNLVGELKNIHCSHYFVKMIVLMFKIKVTSDCFVLPGKYSFDDFDVEQLRPAMVYVWRPGRYAYEIEFRTRVGVVTCIRAVLDFLKVYKVNSKKKSLS